MIVVLTVEQQILVGRAARAVGGYDNLAKLESKRRYCKEHNLPFDIKSEIAKLKKRCEKLSHSQADILMKNPVSPGKTIPDLESRLT